MKANEYRKMTSSDLEKELGELKSELFKLRFQLALNGLENPMKIKTTKKDMAIDNKAEREELNSYFENKGHDTGELKAEKNKTEVKVTKDTKQINTPEVETEFGRL